MQYSKVMIFFEYSVEILYKFYHFTYFTTISLLTSPYYIFLHVATKKNETYFW